MSRRDASGARAFPAHFRRHVMPSVAQGCQVQGFFLALDLIEFENAFLTVMRPAINRGALHLPPVILQDLEDWVCIRLDEVAASHELKISECRQIADRVANENDQYFTAFAALAAVSDDGAWEWDLPL